MRPPPYCSFCRKPAEAVGKLVGGQGVFICDACVGRCREALEGACGEADCVPSPLALEECHLLASLKAAAASVDDTRERLQAHVAALRAKDVSWARIAAALGISRQAAWERFG
ncbi:MAG: hypothetical protein JNJ73_10365 [Hyphomonadaceae bacterium]|nr:hypothetical protein [Hyphomonadaceae bacterium]